MITTTSTLDRARAALGDRRIETAAPRDGLACLRVEPADLHGVLAELRDRAGFESLTFVTAIDRYPAEPRFELVHQLHSLAHGDRLRILTRLGSQDARVASAVDLWPGASFMERECYDMFGVVFEGHPKLERLLMPEGYEHHPLRKDFPHQGIEPDRLYREWDRGRRARSTDRAIDRKARS